MTFKVLIVCAANVCRSPAAEVLLNHALGSGDATGVIKISSGATSVDLPTVRCELAFRQLGRRGIDATLLREQPPRSIHEAEVIAADLILASDRQVAAKVVRIAPRSRAKIFTIPEAASLATVAARREEVNRREAPVRRLVTGSMEEKLAGCVDRMDAYRGRVPVPPSRRPAFSARPRLRSGYDVEDVHGGSRRQHRLMVEGLDSATARIAGAMTAVVVG